MKPRSAAWQQADSILAVRLDDVGDLLMTTPALSALARDPSRRVILLASHAGAAFAAHVPALSGVMTYQAPWVGISGRSGQSDRRFLSKLARQRFDAAVIFTACTQSALAAALMCRMAAIPLRLAYARENPHELLTDWVAEPDSCAAGMRHEVRRQLDLVATVGFTSADDAMVFECRADDGESMRLKLALAGGAVGRPIVVVQPGSDCAECRDVPELFGVAAARIAAQCGAQIVFVGAETDVRACAVAQRAMALTSVSLAGRLSLGELAALIAEARVLVCNDGATSQLAAALGTAVVVLHAAGAAQHAPWRVPSRVLHCVGTCPACLDKLRSPGNHVGACGLEPQRLADAALELWRESAGAARAAPLEVEADA